MSNPQIFGPPLWRMIHLIPFNYHHNLTKEEQQEVYMTFLGLPGLIPCANCKAHCREYVLNNLKEFRIAAQKRDDLFEFFVNFHNEVNKRLGKKIISIGDAKKMYNY